MGWRKLRVQGAAFGIALMWFFLGAIIAQSGGGANLAPEKRSRMEAVTQKFMTANHVPGASVAIVEDGKPVWANGFGNADLENGAPATASTLYRLASVSKPVTAVGAPAAVATWQTGAGRSGAEILSGISAKAVAGHHPRTPLAHGRCAALSRGARGYGDRKHQTF